MGDVGWTFAAMLAVTWLGFGIFAAICEFVLWFDRKKPSRLRLELRQRAEVPSQRLAQLEKRR